MGANSAISWTHHTFNPWWGCEKVSPACAHCYAETWAKRTGHDSLWKGERRFFGDKHWNEPMKWQRAAQDAGERRRVFCASMADVFEDREELIPHRARLFDLIRRTPNLNWLLLTKRPENIAAFLEAMRSSFGDGHSTRVMLTDWTHHDGPNAPHNVWLGTTVENQEMADKRIPELLKVPAAVHFLSCEPLLGPVSLEMCEGGLVEDEDGAPYPGQIDWVICGGESGANARPMNVEWARLLRNQCEAAKVPFHFKQWGEHLSGLRTGKKAAGRLLDGVLHDAFPR